MPFLQIKRPSGASLLPVKNLQDLEYLVKESEVVTGEPGRDFCIRGHVTLNCRLYWYTIGLTFEPLDEHGLPLGCEHLLTAQICGHAIGSALRAGQLFTVALSWPDWTGIHQARGNDTSCIECQNPTGAPNAQEHFTHEGGTP